MEKIAPMFVLMDSTIGFVNMVYIKQISVINLYKTGFMLHLYQFAKCSIENQIFRA